MPSMNHITLIGRLTHDPELRYTPAGDPVANFSLAVDRKMSKTDQCDFIPIVAWRRLAEICNEFLHKGKLVAIEGVLQTRTYEDKEGKKQRAFDVVANEMVMLDRADGQGGGSNGNGGGQRDQDDRPRQQQRSQNDGGQRSQGGGQQRQQSSQGGGQQRQQSGGGRGTQTRQRDDDHSGYDNGGGFPPSDDSLGIDEIPF